jgi:hypothetical protein
MGSKYLGRVSAVFLDESRLAISSVMQTKSKHRVEFRVRYEGRLCEN